MIEGSLCWVIVFFRRGVGGWGGSFSEVIELFKVICGRVEWDLSFLDVGRKLFEVIGGN